MNVTFANRYAELSTLLRRRRRPGKRITRGWLKRYAFQVGLGGEDVTMVMWRLRTDYGFLCHKGDPATDAICYGQERDTI